MGPGHRRRRSRATARSREFNNLFPTNHAHYGYADLLGWRNMDALRGTLALAPPHRTPRSRWTSIVSGCARRAGAWKDDAGEVLGQDPTRDARAATSATSWTCSTASRLRKQLTVLLGYSAFFPGRFAETVRAQGTQHFGYAQVLFKF